MRRTSILVLGGASMLVIAALSQPVRAATTYYVDQSIGNDSYPGTSATVGSGNGPLLTIRAALNKNLVAGDRVWVKNGTYTDSLTMARSGTSGNPIVIENYPGQSPVLDFGFPVPVQFPLSSTDTDRRLYLYNGSLVNPIHDVKVCGFEIKNSYDAIKVQSGDRITICRNWIHDTYGQGILAPGVNDSVIDGNRFTRIGIKWVDTGCKSSTGSQELCNQVHGIYNTGQNWLITNNLFEDTAGGFGIQAAAYGTGDYPSVPASHLGWTGVIANNVFAYHRRYAGIVLYRPTQPLGAIVENNIFYENAQTSSSVAQGIELYNTAAGHIVRNNWFWATSTGSVLPIRSCSSTTATCGDMNPFGWYADGGGNSFNMANPLFANAPASMTGTPDYHLQSGSLAKAVGLNLSSLFTSDLDGSTRPASPTAWSAGAYAAASTSAPPAAPEGLQVH